PTVQPTPGPMLPVLSRARVDGMQVAITVDDCFQLDNVNEIAQIAMDNGAKLTFFPVGRPLKRDPATWKRLHELGFQIECHTYQHNNLLKLDEKQIRRELEMSNWQLNRDLGVQYTYHFLRTPGGSARDDPRVHAIMADLGGYRFMAHWKLSGTGMSGKKMADTILPGDIVLYHSTDKDLAKLRDLIPMAVQQGFQLVTLNELLGLPPNETAPLDDASK
ncbi:MAG: polysaccharide deacetylase family protein, partial [Clostridiales bacterium]|nr:polysaccharide deacetylase family protein [Clostridiales bacterium]